MPRTATSSTRRPVRRATESDLLAKDVAAMIRDNRDNIGGWVSTSDEELARDIIVVVRERVLRELETYARENIR